MSDTDKSAPLAEQWMRALKNHPLVAVVVVVSALIIAFASFADALSKLKEFLVGAPPKPPIEVVVKLQAAAQVESKEPAFEPAAPGSSYLALWECVHPNRRPVDKSADDLDRLRPKQSTIDRALLDMVILDQLGCIPRLIDAGGNPDTYSVPKIFNNYYDGPPLHTAISMRRWDMVRLILSRGADPNLPASHRGDSALHMAIGYSAPKDIQDQLISKGAKNFAGTGLKSNGSPQSPR